jgi:hypothetical protein
MWTLLSFTGKFDVVSLQGFLAKAAERTPPRMPGEQTAEQKEKVRNAQMARALVRRGRMLQRLQRKLSKGMTAKGQGKRNAVLGLNAEQQQVLATYESGELQRRANALTIESGHGRVHRQDGTHRDIGGSTGGLVRVVLDNWEPPTLQELQEEFQEDL